MRLPVWFGAILLLTLTGCVGLRRAPVPPPTPPQVQLPAMIALTPEEWPVLTDTEIESLRQMMADNVARYERRGFAQAPALRRFYEIIQGSTDTWIPLLQADFTLYQSSGVDASRRVTFSAYYEPVIEARRQSGVGSPGTELEFAL